MYTSYFLAALRNLVKHPLNSAINILGLSLGLACCITLLIFITHQLSYDTQFTDYRQIHVLEQETRSAAFSRKSWQLSLETIEKLRANLPDIEQMATLETSYIRYTDDTGQPSHKQIHYTRSSFFQLFDFPFLEGNPADALQQPNDVVLTLSEARNHFGNEPAFGKTLSVGDRLFRVSGVIADIPEETHLKRDNLGIIASADGKPAPKPIAESSQVPTLAMFSGSVRCYVKLAPGVNLDQLNRQVSQFAPSAKQPLVFTAAQAVSMPGLGELAERLRDMKISLYLRPVRNSHLGDSIMGFAMGSHLFQNWPFIYAAIGLALAVLFISCINFINLATARFSLRNLEIGLRKTLGAERRQIFNQFICETLALTSLAVIVALIVAHFGLPWFSNIIQIDLTQVGYATALFFYCLAGLIVLTTLFAGFYPSLILSRVNPVFALGNSNQKVSKSRLRTVLTILQFVFSIFLITVCFTVYYQINHLKTMDMGYDQENIAYLTTPFSRPERKTEQREFARELESHPAVESISVSLESYNFSNNKYRLQGSGKEPVRMNPLATGENFFDHYQMELAAGRGFHYGAISEQSKVERGNFEQAGPIILTLFGLDKLGISSAEAAIGKTLELADGNDNVRLRVIGVVDAFPKMLEQQTYQLMPDFLYYGESPGHNPLSVRFRDGLRSEGIDYLKQLNDNKDGTGRYHVYFPNQQFEPIYQALDRVLSSVTLFAIIAVVVAVMGLYAMSTFVVERRTHEIGVRKVMGSSVTRVILLLLWDFSKPVLIALALAMPLAYLSANQVIQHVAARIPLELIVFGLVPVVVTLIALLTVSGHTIKAANTNPVQALRYE